MLISTVKEKDRRGGKEEQTVLLVPELCKVTGEQQTQIYSWNQLEMTIFFFFGCLRRFVRRNALEL